MFCACPEMQACQLFMSQMGNNEAVQMLGFQSFSTYTDDSSVSSYAGSADVSYDEVGRRMKCTLRNHSCV